MKIRSIFLILIFCVVAGTAKAQHIRVRMNFPVGITIGAPGPAPFGGAIWVGPEWTWRGGNYVCVPGYWERGRGRAMWVPGHWKYTRRGYVWVPGRWR
jgi:hypothetical protein